MNFCPLFYLSYPIFLLTTTMTLVGNCQAKVFTCYTCENNRLPPEQMNQCKDDNGQWLQKDCLISMDYACGFNKNWRGCMSKEQCVSVREQHVCCFHDLCNLPGELSNAFQNAQTNYFTISIVSLSSSFFLSQ